MLFYCQEKEMSIKLENIIKKGKDAFLMCPEEYKNFKRSNKYLQVQIIILHSRKTEDFMDGEITLLVKYQP